MDWFFISHRLPLAEAALRDGYKVYLACKDTGRKSEIVSRGIEFINLDISRSGLNPIFELKLLFNLFRLYYRISPSVVHHVTLKPVIYGSIVAKFLKIHAVVNAISGLGYYFTSSEKKLVKKVMIFFMRFGFNRKNISLIFQNINDTDELRTLNVISKENKLFWIKGSGVDLNVYKSSSFPNFNRVKILFPARMLWDKGVRELYTASFLLKNKYKHEIQFILVGMADTENKAGVSEKFLYDWQDADYIIWLGYQRNMLPIYEDSHIVVLPSYREGMPKTLIEACAMGRAIVTTEAFGCKDCVEHGINGLKVPVKDAQSLADAIEILINDHSLIMKMGSASRTKAEQEFDIKDVISAHLEIYNQFQ